MCCAQLVATPVLPDTSVCLGVPHCGTGSTAHLVGICHLHKLQVQLLDGVQHTLQYGSIHSPLQRLHAAACQLSSAAGLSMYALAAAGSNSPLSVKVAAGSTRRCRCGRPSSCRAGCIL